MKNIFIHKKLSSLTKMQIGVSFKRIIVKLISFWSQIVQLLWMLFEDEDINIYFVIVPNLSLLNCSVSVSSAYV